MPVTFRWLGVAGVELVSSGQTLLIDPYLSRVPIWKSYFGRIQPEAKAADKIERADFIFVTHSHFDHLLDVPEIVKRTGAKVYGSQNTCKLLTALGVAPDAVNIVKPGDSLSLSAFFVKAFPFEHARVPGYGCGPLPPNFTPPLRARDYRMDYGLCFRIEVDGMSILTDPGFRPDVNVQTCVLLTQPYHSEAYYRELLQLIQPKTVIPIHWDNLFSHDPRPYFQPPAFMWPPVRRIDLRQFENIIHSFTPSAKVLILKRFEPVEMG